MKRAFLSLIAAAMALAILVAPAADNYHIDGSQASSVILKSTESAGVHTPVVKHVSGTIVTGQDALSTAAE